MNIEQLKLMIDAFNGLQDGAMTVFFIWLGKDLLIALFWAVGLMTVLWWAKGLLQGLIFGYHVGDALDYTIEYSSHRKSLLDWVIKMKNEHGGP